MNPNTLHSIVEKIKTPGKGILAADESLPTISKRFKAIGVNNEEENRRIYRELLFTTPTLEQYIAGVILFEETLNQKSESGKHLPQILSDIGIVPGIKVDKGKVLLANTNEEVTQGLDGLPERLQTYKAQGAQFAKWRAVYKISDHTPSQLLVNTNAHNLARYAAICQNADVVPIVEPEVLIDGDHSIETCAEVTERVLQALFDALYEHKVLLEGIILKPSMVIPGKSSKQTATPEQVAEYTLKIFRRAVPAAVPTINFLSGGQTPEQATANLNALNASLQPWNLSFSYARALQGPCLEAWRGHVENREAAQQALLTRAKLNSQATQGKLTNSTT